MNNSESSQKTINIDDLLITPEGKRMSLSFDMFFAFAGVNVQVTNLATGALGIALGLSLMDVLSVYLIAGAVGSLAIGLCIVQAKRTGASVMVNARPAFGYFGTRWLAALVFLITAGWFSVNSFFGVTAARSIVSGLGGGEGHLIDLVLLAATIIALVVIAIVGYRWIIRYERLAVVVMGLAIFAVGVGALFKGVNWSYSGTVSGADRVAAIITLITALGIGWAVSWTPYTYDFARHVRYNASDLASFVFGWAGMFLGSFFTFGLSAVIAAGTNSGFDVGLTVNTVLPTNIAMVALLAMVVGLLPANLANLLVGPELLRTLDLRINRAQAVIGTAMLGSPIAVVGIFQPSFAEIFENWMLTLGVWLGPWLTITLVDFFAIHKLRYTKEDLSSPSRGTGGRYFWPGIVSWIIGVLLAIIFTSSPVFTSPLAANLLDNANLNLFVGSLSAGVVYYPWARHAKAKTMPSFFGKEANDA